MAKRSTVVVQNAMNRYQEISNSVDIRLQKICEGLTNTLVRKA